MKKSVTHFIKNVGLSLALVFSVVSLQAQIRGNGNVIKEVRQLTNFTGIDANEGVDVHIKQGNTQKIQVVTDENLIKHLKTEVENGVLRIYSDEQIRKTTPWDVYITVAELNSISSSSGADVATESLFTAQNLKVRVSSGADVYLELDADKIDCDVSSGADAELNGNAGFLRLDVSSGSDAEAGDLRVQNAEVSASSGADAEVQVTGELIARASSGGDVAYVGKPEKLDKHESSGGDVERAD